MRTWQEKRNELIKIGSVVIDSIGFKKHQATIVDSNDDYLLLRYDFGTFAKPISSFCVDAEGVLCSRRH